MEPGCLWRIFYIPVIGLPILAVLADLEEYWFEVVLIGGVFLVVGEAFRHFAHKKAHKEREEVARKTRDAAKHDDYGRFVLYLRPFFITNQLPVKYRSASIFKFPGVDAYRGSDFVDFELILERALASRGKILGLQVPGTDDKSTIAVLPESNEHWESTFSSSADTAAGIVMIPSYTNGTLTEIRYLRDKHLLNKTLFILPPFGDYSESVWSKTRDTLATIGIETPEYSERGKVYLLRQDGMIQDEQLLSLESSTNKAESLSKDIGSLLVRNVTLFAVPGNRPQTPEQQRSPGPPSRQKNPAVPSVKKKSPTPILLMIIFLLLLILVVAALVEIMTLGR